MILSELYALRAGTSYLFEKYYLKAIINLTMEKFTFLWQLLNLIGLVAVVVLLIKILKKIKQ